MMELKIQDLALRDMHWDSVDDWRRLCSSKITNMLQIEYITRDDVFRFYDFVTRDVARKAGIEYEKVREVMDEENQPFIQYVNQIFEGKKKYTTDAPQIRKLKLLLIAPQVDATLKSMIKLYNSLSHNERQEFLKTFGIE